MTHNLGNADRIARIVVAVALVVGSLVAPVPLVVQAVLALTGVYFLGSSLVGTCVGYRLMGVSTCPIKQQRIGT